ncbi:MAG TPA: efflux transporter periplasmic adaptor subunit, partial [Flavobacterium sp.]|nr:efflux transporter periplasmic adaptor subunit [Flavobacterium sp.]
MKKLIYILIGIGIIGLIAFILMNNKKENEAKTAIVAEKNASVSVRIDTVKTEEVSLDFVANGNFEPIQELKFSAEKPGKVIKVLAKEGDYVAVGQTLAIVRSDVVNVEAQTANAAYQNAVTDYNRYENAFKTGGVTKQQLDQAKLAMVNAKAQLTQA